MLTLAPIPDLKARRVLMSAFLYYRCDSPVWSDADYDAAVHDVAAGYGDLNPLRQWQLGPKQEMLASGFRMRLTAATVGGAVAWHKAHFGHEPKQGDLTWLTAQTLDDGTPDDLFGTYQLRYVAAGG